MKRKTEWGYCLFGTGAVRHRLKTLATAIRTARRQTDEDAIHDLRVASRRLRSALSLFGDCFPSKRMRRWQKEIRRVAQALGTVRDTDIQIRYVTAAGQGIVDPALRPGVARLLSRLRERRQQSLRKSSEAIAQLRKRGVLAEIAEVLRELRAAEPARKADDRSPAVYRRARKRVTERLETMLSYECFLRRPGLHTAHHAMRIAAKKLRYTLEALAPLYDEALTEAIVAATETQDGLGEAHDCDVWADVLTEFLAEEKRHAEAYPGSARPMREIVPGIRYLRRDRTAARSAAYARFLVRWKDIQRRGVWPWLVQLLDTAGKTGKAAGRDS